MSTDLQDGHGPVVRLLARLRPAPIRRLTPMSGVTAAALVLILAQAAFRFWASSRSWFMWDDYIFIADVTRGDTSFGWLFHSHFSLVQPIGFAMVWLVGQAGFTWWVYALHIVVLQLLASVACWVMLRVVFGNHRLILLPLLLYLLSPLTMPGSVWWSVAIYQYPFHVAIFGAITCHVVWLRSRSPWALGGAFAFLALGLGSYLKAPLIPFVLLGISLLWFTRGGIAQRARTLAGQWPAWLGYALLLGGYVWLWASRQTVAPPRQSCEAFGVVETSLVESVGSSLLGGPLSWRLWTGGIDPLVASSDCVPQAYRGDPDLIVGGAPQSLASPPLALVVVAVVAVVLLVLHRCARHHHAAKVLAIVVPYLLASAAIVLLGRAGTWGSQISAREVRYFADVAAIGAFALAAALLAIRGAPVALRPRTSPLITRPLTRGLVQWLVAGFVLFSLVSSATYVAPWHSTDSTKFPERAYVAEVRKTLAEAGGSMTVADVPLPLVVANPVIAPYNLPSRKLAPLKGLEAVTQGTDLQMLDDQGRLRSATIPDQPRAEPGPVENCGYQVQSDSTTIPVTGVVPGPFWVRIDYLSSANGDVDVQAGPMFRRIAVERGLHTLLFQSSGDFTSVELTTSAGVTLCVDNVHVGPVEPVEEDAS